MKDVRDTTRDRWSPRRWAGAVGVCLLGVGLLLGGVWLMQGRPNAIPGAIPGATPGAGAGIAAVADKPARGADGDEPVDFNRDIRPILSDRCFACHGPDAAVAKDAGGFRLDSRSHAVVELDSGATPIVPGDAQASEVLRRIAHTNPKRVMPPPASKLTLTKGEIELLRRWIDEGAPYAKHWAYQTPTRPALPTIENAEWARNDIDTFIAARLEAVGLSPSQEADRATLIRRLSLDLIGLPATPEEIDAFINDDAPDAYEKLVDRLLASPHFGERMAVVWLDAARYADTIGYQLDHYRNAWPYRDWVINAFNDNKPYDQFVVEQLAGDLLPDATDAQKLATAFCRMHMMNHEGGSIDEEFRVTAVADRIETISTVFMAQTFNCAMCHDHKYDPTTQQDYYNLFKYFHSIDERGVHSNKPERAIAYAPHMEWMSRDAKAELAEAKAKLADAQQARRQAAPGAVKAQETWEQALREQHAVRWADAKLTDAKTTHKSGTFDHKPDGSVLLSSRDIPGVEDLTLVYKTHATGLRLIRLDALTDPLNGDRVGRASNGDAQPTHIKITATSLKDHSNKQQVEVTWAWADKSEQGKVKGKETGLGPRNLLKPGRPGWGTGASQDKDPRTLLLVAKEPFGFEGGTELRVFIEHRSGKSHHTLGRLRLGFASADASVIEAFPDHAEADDTNDKDDAVALQPLALIAPADRTGHGRKTLAEQWRTSHSPRYAQFSDAVAKAERAVKQIEAKAVPVSIMQELVEPKPMYVLERGAYDKPIEDRPAKLELPIFIDLPMPEGAPNNRLGFALWLTRPDHPLTARVQVNRVWQMLFGTGIVKTTEDFGNQADWPSHPQLLDALAVGFVESGWDNKALIKTIVMSATYRQRAVAQAQAVEVDPDNRLLSSFPRRRLPGELVRDQALAVSGLLVHTIGGPSVKPYQPPGLWREVSMSARSNTHVFKRDDGEALYRRSLYTFIKRKSPPPQLQTFGAPNRESCVVRRDLTNTPMQTLVLWNDEQLLEASRVLAQRTLAEAQGDDARLSLMFRRCTGAVADERELGVLREALGYYRHRYGEASADAAELLEQGEHPLPEAYDPAELASWMMVAGAVLSLDETIVRD